MRSARLERQVRLWLAAAGLAVVTASSAGAANFSSLNIDFVGRGAATQGLAARPGEAANAFWNPSGLACLDTGRGTGFAGYADYLAGSKGGTAGYVWSAVPGRGFGAYLTYLTSGSVPVTTWSDPVGGDLRFGYGEFAAGFSGGARLHRRLLVGAGLKLARENLDDLTATGGFLDFGGTVDLAGPRDADRGLAAYLGVAARNLVVGRWGSWSGVGPTCTEAALAIVFPGGTAAGASFVAGRDGRREARLGLAAMLSGEFEARFGWRRRLGQGSDAAYDLPWQRGLSAGFGVSLGRFWVDYTYEDASPLAAIHRFALRADFSAIKPTD